VDHGKQGLKRSIVTDAGGVPLSAIPAAANRRDGRDPGPLDSVAGLGLLPARPVVHLDAGYDYQTCRRVLHERGMAGQIATRGVPTPRRAAAGRCSAPMPWGNQDGKLCWCTKRRRLVVAFWLALANAAIVLGRLVRRVWACYRWDARPRRRHNTSTGCSPHASAGGPLIGADDGCASECAVTG
jgi:hypothetical protein